MQVTSTSTMALIGMLVSATAQSGDTCRSAAIPATETNRVATVDKVDAVGTFTLTNEGDHFILTSQIQSPFTMKYPRVRIGTPKCWDITDDYAVAGNNVTEPTRRYWVAVCSSDLRCSNGKLEVSFAPRLKRAISGESTVEDMIFSGCYYRSSLGC
jgi:hypothetical protein